MAITDPSRMNEGFADAFNSRDIANLLALYEPDAVLRVDSSDRDFTGLSAIEEELQGLIQVPGKMTSRSNFCIRNGDLALLRADWEIISDDVVVASGSSAELVRRQLDGTWRYVIDHATGASVQRVS